MSELRVPDFPTMFLANLWLEPLDFSRDKLLVDTAGNARKRTTVFWVRLVNKRSPGAQLAPFRHIN